MLFQEFKELYPKATLHTTPASEIQTLSIPYDNQYIWIPKQHLSQRERSLLKLLIKDFPKTNSYKKHPWYSILFEHQPVKEEGHYRILQVKFNEVIEHLKDDWLQEIQQMLPNVVDCFFLAENYALIVECQEENLPTNELDGLFMALDMDFDCYTQLFVGAFHHSRHDFTLLLKEEEIIFSQEILLSEGQKSFDLPKAAIHLIRHPALVNGQLLVSLYQDWFKENELTEAIQLLWKHQGNASSTAKDLFMHRNTLLYKIEKFQQTTLLNLKEMDDLFLCYLLVKNYRPH